MIGGERQLTGTEARVELATVVAQLLSVHCSYNTYLPTYGNIYLPTYLQHQPTYGNIYLQHLPTTPTYQLLCSYSTYLQPLPISCCVHTTPTDKLTTWQEASFVDGKERELTAVLIHLHTYSLEVAHRKTPREVTSLVDECLSRGGGNWR